MRLTLLETGRSESFFVVAHELDADGTIMRSIALSEEVFELFTVVICLVVFTMIIRWVFEV